MELVDRYLQAVGFWLSKNQKKDIVAELSEDLHTQIEEQESTLHRPLNEDEVTAIVKKFGPPLMVAQRYQPQRYLIGPNTFPIYWFVLKLNWKCVFGPWFVIGLCLDLFVAVMRDSRYHVLAGVLDHFWIAAFVNLTVITMIFAILDHYQPDGLWQNWNPQKLPKVRDLNRIPRSSSISELAWYAVLLLWWVNILRLPSISGVEIVPSPFISRYLYWPILLGILLQAVMAGINVFRPWWTPIRATLRGVADVLGLVIATVLLAVFFSGGSLAAVTSAQLPAAEIASMQHWISWGWAAMVLVWAEIGYLVRLIQDARRVVGREPIRNWAIRLFAGD